MTTAFLILPPNKNNTKPSAPAAAATAQSREGRRDGPPKRCKSCNSVSNTLTNGHKQEVREQDPGFEIRQEGLPLRILFGVVLLAEQPDPCLGAPGEPSGDLLE